jgi:hypothetical protein
VDSWSMGARYSEIHLLAQAATFLGLCASSLP